MALRDVGRVGDQPLVEAFEAFGAMKRGLLPTRGAPKPSAEDELRAPQGFKPLKTIKKHHPASQISTCRQRHLHVSVGREALPEMEIYDFRASRLTVLKLVASSELQKERRKRLAEDGKRTRNFLGAWELDFAAEKVPDASFL